MNWRGDPASFENFPQFFLAHELAHQWWGQAIGWKNYHEQWISEGFAQYFAALTPEQRGAIVLFANMLRQFRDRRFRNRIRVRCIWDRDSDM